MNANFDENNTKNDPCLDEVQQMTMEKIRTQNPYQDVQIFNSGQQSSSQSLKDPQGFLQSSSRRGQNQAKNPGQSSMQRTNNHPANQLDSPWQSNTAEDVDQQNNQANEKIMDLVF